MKRLILIPIICILLTLVGCASKEDVHPAETQLQMGDLEAYPYHLTEL